MIFKWMISGIIVVGLFIYFRSKGPNKTVNMGEPFDWHKLKKSLHLRDKVEWAKDISSLFNLRKLLIYAIIIGGIYGYGYWKALRNRPINIPLRYGREIKIKIDNSYLRIRKNGSVVIETPQGKVLKTIAVKDIEGLKKELKPVGIMLTPIFVNGFGFGTNGGTGESGVGISWFRYFRGRLESLITYRGIYPLAVSYKITKNSGVGIGAGKSWKNGDNRIMVYWRWEF